MSMATNINNNVKANSGVWQVTKNILAAVLLAAGCTSAMANVLPQVKILSVETNGASPATIKLEADATDSDGSIAKVEFFSGTALIGTATQAPFIFAWTGAVTGSYSITAKATDNHGASTVTVATSVVVGPSSVQSYYIHSDQIDTAKLITNGTGHAVWKSDLEPFGANLPDENPRGQGAFVYNNRFPGQYFDRETGLHYNYYRDYDPQTGRYVKSDPIGLEGGINTYGYVGGNPVSNIDPDGLKIVVVGDTRGEYQKAVAYISRDPGMAAIIKRLTDSPIPYTVRINYDNEVRFDEDTNSIDWDPTSALCLKDNNRNPTGESQSPAMGLGHEMDHMANQVRGVHYKTRKKPWGTPEEQRVIQGSETALAKALGEGVRTNHFGQTVKVSGSTKRPPRCGCI
jgi:RHS repeat-associated protein